jgi:glycosyltransferase involved in cell wall biosynthesis
MQLWIIFKPSLLCSAVLPHMSDLTISLAMCTFNGKRFLGAQLESIGAQSRPPDELVICDDGSSDGSVELIREFARHAPFPTRLVVNERNLGSTRNFEPAILLCQGKIVALADQDDVWYPHKLEQIDNAFAQSRSIALAFSDADLIDDNTRLLGLRLWATFSFNRSEQKEFANGHALNILAKHPVVTGATMAFRKELFDLITPIPEGHIHDAWISFLLADPVQFACFLSRSCSTGNMRRSKWAQGHSACVNKWHEQRAR